MPVVANQKVLERLYDYPVRHTGWAVFDTVSSNIHQKLHIFRVHHQKCAARRKHALSYELRQENQRTEWLRRKYLDSIRQQQAVSARVESTNSRGFEDPGQNSGGEHQDQLSELKHNTSADSPPEPMDTPTKKTPATISADTNTHIKKEPGDVDECLSPPSKVSSEAPNTKTDDLGQSIELKRRLSQTMLKTDMSKWSSLNGAEDTRDELKLTAYDVIAGVISTPPIEPLEQDADNSHTTLYNGPSPPSANSKSDAFITTCSTMTTTTTTSAPLPTPAFSKNRKDQQTLVQDLDEFSKVYHQVTQEQIAKERRHSLASELEPAAYPGQSHQRPTPPYIAVDRARQLSQNDSTYYQQHKYGQLQAPPSIQSQVNSTYQPKNVKSQLVLPPACVMTESPASNASHIPATPTTPLEHFSNFQSPPPHHPLATPTNQTAPPPPYSSTALRFPYSHEPVCQTVSASSGNSERWSLPSHPQQHLQHSVLSDTPITTQHENAKETILAHGSSHVVALAGQKRPNQEFNGSVLPPTKLQTPLLNFGLTNSNNSSHLHGYHPSPGVPLVPAPPYPGPSAPVPTFPHHP